MVYQQVLRKRVCSWPGANWLPYMFSMLYRCRYGLYYEYRI